MTELDCSDGARMLIERMQTNPEDFSYAGKLYRAINTDQMSTRDIRAYNDAHDRYIKEPRLMAEVLKALLVQPEKEEMRVKTQGPIRGTTVDKVWFDERTDSYVLADQKRITREMYEDHIQTHKDHIQTHLTTVRAEKEGILSDIYNKTFGRQRIERDN